VRSTPTIELGDVQNNRFEISRGTKNKAPWAIDYRAIAQGDILFAEILLSRKFVAEN
jgi:hypothetical protein